MRSPRLYCATGCSGSPPRYDRNPNVSNQLINRAPTDIRRMTWRQQIGRTLDHRVTSRLYRLSPYDWVTGTGYTASRKFTETLSTASSGPVCEVRLPNGNVRSCGNSRPSRAARGAESFGRFPALQQKYLSNLLRCPVRGRDRSFAVSLC